MSSFSESLDSFTIQDLAEKLSSDQLTLQDMGSKDIILLMGTTNAGKTTTLCYLAGKKLKMKMEEIIDDDGETSEKYEYVSIISLIT